MIDDEKLSAVALQAHIDSKLAYIAGVLPYEAKNKPDGFLCGRHFGYKQALLDIERAFERDEGDL